MMQHVFSGAVLLAVASALSTSTPMQLKAPPPPPTAAPAPPAACGAPGTACCPNSVCGPALSCTGGKCWAPMQLNQACNATSGPPCAAGKTCSNGTCKAQSGQWCSATSDCANVAAGEACLSNTCRKPAAGGGGSGGSVQSAPSRPAQQQQQPQAQPAAAAARRRERAVHRERAVCGRLRVRRLVVSRRRSGMQHVDAMSERDDVLGLAVHLSRDA
jgi:hypothetical protein